MGRWTIVALLWVVLSLPVSLFAQSSGEREFTAEERDYELFKVFVDTLDQVERNYVEEVDRRELIEAAIRGMIDKLDPYSNYISPDEADQFRDKIESQFGGIGIQITVEDGQLKVLSPLVGTPAYEAGLHAGDEIIEIEGKSTKGISIDEAVRRLKGEVGTKVTMKVRTAYVGKVREVTVERKIIRVNTVLGERRKEDDSWDYMLDPQKKIGYIRITSFSRDTASEMRDALRQLEEQGLRGLVLDLRFNPGGLLTAAVEICDMFVEEGTIVSIRGRNVRERVEKAHRVGTYTNFPIAVLINRYSASASEIVSACLQDHERAIVVGERSWGKGSVQNVIDLEGGRSALKLTTASYWRPSGKNIHRMPDSKDSDEWGVSPNDGYKLKLNDAEMRQLVALRRDKDVIRWTKEDAIEGSEQQPEEGTENKEPEEAEKQPPEQGEKKEEKKFVDRQLEKALSYLSNELVKAE